MLALWPALARAPTVCACAPGRFAMDQHLVVTTCPRWEPLSELERCRKSGRRSAANRTCGVAKVHHMQEMARSGTMTLDRADRIFLAHGVARGRPISELAGFLN